PESMERRDAWLGVDVGGTWIRLAALSAGGKTLARRRLRREPRRPLADLVRRFASSSRFKLRAVVVGSTGYGRAADRRRLEAELRRAAAKARVLTDLELAWAGAFEKEGV